MSEPVIYEQPLNEIVRACLRLEQLFERLDHQTKDTSELGTRTVIITVIDILHSLERPDLKSKLAKELTSHLTALTRYSNRPEIDSTKLQKISEQLKETSQGLINNSMKIGQRVRDVELLNNLRLHLANPGGGCNFDIPLLHYWLKRPAKVRRQTIEDWLTDFKQIRSAINLLLDLVRKNAKTEEKTAIHGFHQELLDPQANLRMVRIGITSNIPAYPEMSVGRHFLSVRFFSPDIEKRPTQYPDNLQFWLAYCNL